MQSLSLKEKIELTIRRIRDWIKTYGEDGVYVSFSGGKDSTVLLDIVRKEYPDIKAVFFDTGLEYPEIREFVKTFDNVEWIKPKMNFKQVIQTYGYPFISKEVSECVYGAKKYLKSLETEGGGSYKYRFNKLCGIGKYEKQSSRVDIANNDNLIILADEACKNPNSGKGYSRYQRLTGQCYTPQYKKCRSEFRKNELSIRVRENDKNRENRENSSTNENNLEDLWKIQSDDEGGKGVPSEDLSPFNCERYKFFLENGAPPISNQCCYVMKKSPAHSYQKKTGRNPIMATMANESRIRKQAWLKSGCNGFDMKRPTSNPMAFWTEDDVLQYIYENHLPICLIYGDVVKDFGKNGQIEGQMDFTDYGVLELEKPFLKTTGLECTGCIFCAYGLNREKSPNRFEQLAETHPVTYDYVMRGGAFDENGDWRPDKNGLGYWYCIEWINKHGNFNIQYPNREYYLEKYMTEETKKYL